MTTAELPPLKLPHPNVPRGVSEQSGSFQIPRTLGVLSTLLNWRCILSPFTGLNWLIFLLEGFLFVAPYLGYIDKDTRTWVFGVLAVFWRCCYNLLLGFILRRQSHDQVVTRTVKGLLEKGWYQRLLESSVVFRATEKKLYRTSDYPIEYNAWMSFRFLVNVILNNDLICFALFTFSCWNWVGFTEMSDMILFVAGWLLSAVALWAKKDAYRVLGEYGWYWGDFFFLLDSVGDLKFDGVMDMVPHPMYTVGYFFMYGAGCVSQSYSVFYLAVLSHVMQLAFLSVVENPHIEKTYNTINTPTHEEVEKQRVLNEDGYFNEKKDLILYFNLDWFRSSDLLQVMLGVYLFTLAIRDQSCAFHLLHAFAWRVILGGLYYSLHQQSTRELWTNSYISKGWTKRDAFDGWKKVYNLTLTFNHFTALIVAFHCQGVVSNQDWFGLAGFRITLGCLAIAMNVWTSMSCYEVLGDFGFFYGDFFITEVPTRLHYGGIYRFMNNPDTVMGFAAYYGLAAISWSWTSLLLAVVSQLLHVCNVILVERPHMWKVYGNPRQVGGLESGVRTGVQKIIQNAPVPISPTRGKKKHTDSKNE